MGANSALIDYGTTSALHNIPVTKNGFVYIYCSNESPVDVFFDNLQAMHTRGQILEDTLALDEEFNDACEHFNFPTIKHRCNMPDCESSFKNYFNQRLGGSYTNYQIDTLYQRQCGIIPDPCGTYSSPILCGKNEPIFPFVSVSESDPCLDSSGLAFIKATELYNNYIDSLKNAFNSAYMAKCMQAFKTENFTLTHPENIYHTLYYYDQAGNLVKTVPPAGIDTTKFRDTTWSNQVTSARLAGTYLTPSHWLKTEYRYNTLNQVVEQKNI